MGKPEPSFFELALKDMNLKPENVWMIGDDIKDDILGAMRLGMKGILVKTGKYQPGDESLGPSFVFNTFSEAIDFFLSL